MAVTYAIEFDVLPGRRPAFLELLSRVLDEMRHEGTFQEAVLHVDAHDDHRFMLYETWEDHQDVLQVQLHRAYRQAWHDALPDLLSKPRAISVWSPVRVDRR